MTTPDIRLVAIDLDGTLLDSNKRLDAGFPEVLTKLLARGIAVVPASGRQYASIQQYVGAPEHHDGELDIIAENGALVVREGEVVSVDAVTREGADLALERVAAYAASGAEAGAVLCGRRTAYLDRGDEAFLEVIAGYYPVREVVSDLREVAREQPDEDFLKIALWDYAGAEGGLIEAVGQIPGHRTLVSGHSWLDIMSPTADKGHALERLQRELGVGPEHTMVFGDFPNDVGMLQRSEWSYAMADAHPLAAAAARFRAPSNDEEGVSRTLREVLKL